MTTPRPATEWPQEIDIPSAQQGFTLVMVVHPHCPCTRASLQELAKVMRHATLPVTTIVLVSRPAGTVAGFESSSIWTQAEDIPGVNVQTDPEGRAARLLGLSVSGSTSIYSPERRLLFSGGITSARGHAGDNAGSDALIGLLTGAPTGLSHTPVFGCALFAANESCTTTVTGEEAQQCCE